MNVIETLSKYEPKGLWDHEVPVVWESADGVYVYAIDGKKYLDFSSGIFVANVGHHRVHRAVDKQSAWMLHNYIFPTELRARLVERIAKLCGTDKVLLTVTGSEANEAALQIMRRRAPNAGVMSVADAYYGSTTETRRLGQRFTIDETLLPSDPIYRNLHYAAGLFLQAFRGKDAKFLPVEWVQAWVGWAHEHDIPVAWDEMQSGFGRTGKMFGYEHYGIKPDLITMGKAMGGGLPISCVTGRADLIDLADDLWSTHTGNPVCCAAALENIDIIEREGLVERAKELGEWIEPQLREMFKGYEVNGKGLMCGIVLGDVGIVRRIVMECAKQGLLLVSTHGLALKIAPPLIISKEELLRGCQIIRDALTSVTSG